MANHLVLVGTVDGKPHFDERNLSAHLDLVITAPNTYADERDPHFHTYNLRVEAHGRSIAWVLGNNVRGGDIVQIEAIVLPADEENPHQCTIAARTCELIHRPIHQPRCWDAFEPPEWDRF